jgi:hypothetical protein
VEDACYPYRFVMMMTNCTFYVMFEDMHFKICILFGSLHQARICWICKNWAVIDIPGRLYIQLPAYYSGFSVLIEGFCFCGL